MAVKEPGVKALLYIETAADTYTLIGGQQDATLNRETEIMEGYAKDDNGWMTRDAGAKSWSLEMSAFLPADDVAYDFLEDAWENNQAIKVKLERPNGAIYEGNGIISELPVEHPVDEYSTYSLTIEGTGALVKTATTTTTS
ncbi:phage tail tube protein [Thermoactinomyces sp. FSL K6-2592]|jgi:TP901-1 family phage major tail protein|uniref:phage tail tube protein n=1 Tax=Thermoactinomyces sp. FSL K6-2592 TaxID=2975347 RepID=UPI0030F8BC92